MSAGMVQLFIFYDKGCKKIMITLDCARILIRGKVSMHVETVCLLSRKAQ